MTDISILGLDHIVLRVQDLDRMLNFYCGILGLVVERRVESIGLIQVRAGNSLIDLVPVDSPLGRSGGAAPGEEGRNLEHFCLRIAQPVNESLRSYLLAQGLQVEPPERRYGAEGFGPSVYVADPEGNRVELKGPTDKSV